MSEQTKLVDGFRRQLQHYYEAGRRAGLEEAAGVVEDEGHETYYSRTIRALKEEQGAEWRTDPESHDSEEAVAEITDERLDELEGCEEWFDYLLRELEDLTDSLDEHVTISDVHEAIRSLTVRMRNGGRPESHVSGSE